MVGESVGASVNARYPEQHAVHWISFKQHLTGVFARAF
jgi:hypothetical protein